jgi:photosystem II Psb27 protein
MKRYFSCLWALALAIVLSIAPGLPAIAAASLSGDYLKDTQATIETFRTALATPDDSPERPTAQADARKLINDYMARYRRNPSLLKLPSFTTMRTAINSLAGHYTSYPNRPVPEKMKTRLEQEFKQVELALQRGS